jgi:methyl-accepting chemotaxis protein
MNINNKFTISFLVVALALVGAIVLMQYYSLSDRSGGQVMQLTSFVSSAEELVKQKGQEAFNDLRDANGQWVSGDNYIFVYDMDGNTIVLPPQPELEGTSRLAAQDPEGKYFVKDMIDILKIKNDGWLEYKYAKPGETENSTKLSYFKKVMVGEKEYFVGSGIYLD